MAPREDARHEWMLAKQKPRAAEPQLHRAVEQSRSPESVRCRRCCFWFVIGVIRPPIPSFSIISIMVQRGSLSFSHLFVIPLNMSDHELLIYEPPEPWQHPLTPKRCHRSVQAIPTVAGEAAAFANGQMVRIKTSYWKQLQVPAAAKSGSCHWRVCHFSGFSYTLSLPHSGNVLECVPPDAMEAALGEAVATQMNRCI